MAEVCKDLGEQLDRTEFYDWIKLQLHTQSSSFSKNPNTPGWCSHCKYNLFVIIAFHFFINVNTI